MGSLKIVSEIFKDVGQEKNVRKKIVIVIILEIFHVVMSPNVFCPVVIFLGEGFIVKRIVKGVDGWELGFPEFLRSSHVRVGVHAFCEYPIVVSQMFDGVDKFIATTF